MGNATEIEKILICHRAEGSQGKHNLYSYCHCHRPSYKKLCSCKCHFRGFYLNITLALKSKVILTKVCWILTDIAVSPFTYCTFLGHLGQSNTNITKHLMHHIAKGRKCKYKMFRLLSLSKATSKKLSYCKCHFTSFGFFITFTQNSKFILRFQMIDEFLKYIESNKNKTNPNMCHILKGSQGKYNMYNNCHSQA